MFHPHVPPPQALHSAALSHMTTQLRSATPPIAVAALPLSIRQASFTEWADLTAGGLPEAAATPLLHVLAAAWALPTEDTVPQYQRLQTPAYQVAGDALVVGRVAMQRAATESGGQGASGMAFALTGHTLRMLQRVAVAVDGNEGVLLVGESGTGKTSMVQRLALQVAWTALWCSGFCGVYVKT